MTLGEYFEKVYPEAYRVMEEQGDYGVSAQYIFPTSTQSQYLQNIPDYQPFDFSGYSHGGIFAEEVSFFIYVNFRDVTINDRYVSEIPATINKPSKIQRIIHQLLMRYQYKWHALWESMQIDDQYDILDNVNEIFDETHTRTPNLTHSESGNNVYGQKQTETTQTHGNIETSNEVEYGQHEEVNTTEFGATSNDNITTENPHIDTHKTIEAQHTDEQTNVIAQLHNKEITDTQKLANDVHVTENSKYPFDDAANGKITDRQTLTDTIGATKNTVDNTTDSHTDTMTYDFDEQTKTLTDTISEHKTIVNDTSTAHSDELTKLSKTHTDTTTGSVTQGNDVNTSVTNTYTDTHSNTVNETGNERTVIERRRHGNIGVTTSGQLIEDFRKTHYFDLVKIVAYDIANEILSMLW